VDFVFVMAEDAPEAISNVESAKAIKIKFLIFIMASYKAIGISRRNLITIY